MQKRGNENKPHVGIFGRCNVGKSTLFNMLVGEDNALVSNVAGTTTDPVRRAFEIPFFAPVLLIDTPGLGDISVLGSKRIDKSLQILDVVDMAILLFEEWEVEEERFLEEANKRGVPTLLIYNLRGKSINKNPKNSISLDISDIVSRGAVCEKIKEILPKYSYEIGSMLGDRISENDLVFLVAPIDSEAPAGRLILPQVQTIRDILDNKAITMVFQPEQLKKAFSLGVKPKLVVTDSQVYDIVLAQTPKDIVVETFSALLAEFKGDMAQYKKGLSYIDTLKDYDTVLILESCLHHTTCDDIGRKKLPMWLEKYTGKKLNFEFISGLSPLPSDMSKYAMALQCGACMITRRQLMRRLHALDIANVPVTNYGMCIKKILVKL